jgi:hypothetical protein
MQRRMVSGVAIGTLLLVVARDARAQHASQAVPEGHALPAVELDYQVAVGLPCPTAEALRAYVANALGFDPFDATVPGMIPVGRFHVAVARTQRGALVIRARFEDPSGGQSFDTAFDARPIRARTCDHLLRLHVTEEIATELRLQRARVQALVPPSTTCPATAAPEGAPSACWDSRYAIWPERLPKVEKPKPSPELPERWPIAVRLGAAVWPELVASGWGSLGLSVEGGARYRFVSASVEVHGDPPIGSVTFQNAGTVSFARVSGALLVCGHYSWFVGCGVGDAGRFIFPNHVQVLPASTFYGAVGARVGLEFPVAPPRFFLRVAVDMRAPIPPASYARQGAVVFETAGPGIGIGIGGLFELAP